MLLYDMCSHVTDLVHTVWVPFVQKLNLSLLSLTQIFHSQAQWCYSGIGVCGIYKLYQGVHVIGIFYAIFFVWPIVFFWVH